MRLRRPDWRGARFGVGIIALCAASGLAYTTVRGHGDPLNAAVYGACCGGLVMAYERGCIAPRLRGRLRALPWLPSVIATEAVYIALIQSGAALSALCLIGAGVEAEPFGQAAVLGYGTLLYALAVSGVVVVVTRMRDLIGAETFRNILLGRYHRPVEEERIFVFLDLVGSTAFARTHGDLRAQAWLGAVFAALAEPVRRHGGSIDDYVGDMAMITWPMASGIREGRCLSCIRAFLEGVAADADLCLRDHGQVPEFRAAFHGGPVVTAEVGVDRHKISYFGDVVNTAGRMEVLCRTLGTPMLISGDLLRRMPALPPGVSVRTLGSHDLKGRGEALAVYALALG